MKEMQLAYCDYIAYQIQRHLKHLCNYTYEKQTEPNFLSEVSGVNMDLNENGTWKSTKKSVTVSDFNGKKYLVTVEEL